MVKYRNVRHGAIVERQAEDEGLEAAGTWERIDEPTEAPAEDNTESEDDTE